MLKTFSVWCHALCCLRFDLWHNDRNNNQPHWARGPHQEAVDFFALRCEAPGRRCFWKCQLVIHPETVGEFFLLVKRWWRQFNGLGLDFFGTFGGFWPFPKVTILLSFHVKFFWGKYSRGASSLLTDDLQGCFGKKVTAWITSEFRGVF